MNELKEFLNDYDNINIIKEENQIISIIYDNMIISDINIEFYYSSDLFEMIYRIIYNFIKKYIKDYELN